MGSNPTLPSVTAIMIEKKTNNVVSQENFPLKFFFSASRESGKSPKIKTVNYTKNSSFKDNLQFKKFITLRGGVKAIKSRLEILKDIIALSKAQPMSKKKAKRYRQKLRRRRKLLSTIAARHQLIIKCSMKTIHVNISDSNNKVIKTFTTGKGNGGFKKAGRRKPAAFKYLCKEITAFISEVCLKKKRLFNFSIVLKGFNPKRIKVLRPILKKHYKRIGFIRDLSSLPHNGCRPKKVRRI